MKKHPILDYDWVTSNIAVGTNQCCTTHFEPALLRKGIRADISLENERLDAARGATVFLWLPTRDHRAPSQTQLAVGANTLRDLVRRRVKTYVHCKNGHGRAPTLVAAYLILRGASVDAAVRRVTSRRRHAHLNALQLRALRNFKKTL